ncbi:MAG TPA: hypothetical protein VMH22_12970 [bacterium]|nr:hypothetical protein [bacterium]
MTAVRRVESAADLDRFVKLPFQIYRDDPNWVPPLISDFKNTLTPGCNPFWEHAERDLYLAVDDGKVVGRVAAILDRNYNRHHGVKVACFGFFESENDSQVAAALLDTVKIWGRQRDMDKVYGPANPSLNDEVALLIGPFDSPPMLKMSYNPPWYATLIESCGFAKVKDMYAYVIPVDVPVPEKLQRVMTRLKQNPEVEVRPVDLKHLERDIVFVKDVYNDAWSHNWDHVPMTDAEITDLARQLKPLVKPELCPLVFYKGEIAGMCVALPDYNQVLKRLHGSLFPFGWLTFLTERNRMDQARLWTLGVKYKFHNLGFDSLLYYECFLGARKLGYRRGELSLILEDNIAIIRPITMWGGKVYKTYRIYESPA